jgi:hypothetical protein
MSLAESLETNFVKDKGKFNDGVLVLRQGAAQCG